jgi:CHAT domain-containing protein/tetratricopeptide (TPR) repeat protein
MSQRGHLADTGNNAARAGFRARRPRRGGPAWSARLCLLLAPLLLAGCGAAFIANEESARRGFASSDVAALDKGDLATLRTQYEQVPPDQLPLRKLALLCDILLKYQDLGRAVECIDQVDRRAAADSADRDPAISRAVRGKSAMLALATGQPERAARLSEGLRTSGGRYVHALAMLRLGDPAEARSTAAQLRKDFEPGPVFEAASLYAALQDFPSVRAVLEDPARRMLRDYALSGHADIFGTRIDAAVFRFDPFDEFDFGLLGKATLAPAANPYVEYLAALAYLRTGSTQEAERRYDTLLNFPYIGAYRDVQWRALTDRAEMKARAGDTATAERMLREAIDIIESVRGSIGAEAARIGVAADKEMPYRRLIGLLVRRGANEDALLYAVRGQSRALVELLATRTHFGPPVAGGSAADRLVAAYSLASGEEQIAAETSPAEVQTRAARVRAARRKLINDAPDVADLVAVEPPELDRVRRALVPGQAVLAYFQGEGQWFVFTLTARSLTTHVMPDGDVAAPAQGLHQALTQTTLDDSWRGSATALYRGALAPALQGIDATSLIIIPAGDLHRVPFAAVVDEEGKFLVDRYTLRVVPNLQLLTRPSARESSRQALVIGDPLNGDPQFGLPFAALEAQAIAQKLPGSTLVVGRQATVANMMQMATGHDLIHFAGHGTFNEKDPLRSGLLLASPSGREDLLTAERLYDMRTTAALVYLSGCETGLGKNSGGEDIIGLQRGFFFAGAQTVIGSLWTVNDASTAVLGLEFYQAWTHGQTAARALRSAQIATRARFAHPRYWGGFYATSVGPE